MKASRNSRLKLFSSLLAYAFVSTVHAQTSTSPAGANRSSATSATSKAKPETPTVQGQFARTPITSAELQLLENSPTLNRIRSQQKLVIAFSKTASPFSIADTDGSAKGFAIDLCTKVALSIQKQLKLADLKIEFVSPPFNERLQAIREGKADMECGNTIANAERQKTLGFSIPTFLTVTKILVKNDSSVNNLTGLRGKQVVTTANSSSEKVFTNVNQKFGVGAQLSTRKTAAEAFSAISKGEVDAFFMSDIVISDLLSNVPDAKQYRMLRDAYSVDGIAIVLNKDDPGMKVIVDRELKRIMSDEEIYRFYDKWFSSPIPPNNINLSLKVNQLTRDHYKRPSDQVVYLNLF